MAHPHLVANDPRPRLALRPFPVRVSARTAHAGWLVILPAALALQFMVHGPLKSVLLLLAPAGAERLLVALSFLHLTLGVVVFLRAGGRRITPTGVYFLATVLYFGYGGVARAAERASVQYLVYASVTALAFNLVALWLSTGSPLQQRERHAASEARQGTPSPARSTPPSWLLLCAAIWATLTLGASVVRGAPIVGEYVEFLQIAASLLLAQAYLTRSTTSHTPRALVAVPAITALALGAYVAVFYSGYARIVFAGFAVGLATLVARRYPQLPTKGTILLLLVPFVLLAASGERTGLSVREAAAGFGEARGITSMTGVLPILAEALEVHNTTGLDAYAHRSGRTFLVSAVHWVPREWWPAKPIGPEIELAQLLRPEIFFGHSIVGSNIVEWLLNFDIAGIVLGALLTGLLLARLDRWVDGRGRGQSPNTSLALRALVTGNLVIYVWAGSFSFTARTFIGSVLLLLISLLERRYVRTSRSPQRQPARS